MESSTATPHNNRTTVLDLKRRSLSDQMDWSNVTIGELWDSLREVDWKAPRPVSEFILQPNSFLPPKSGGRWSSRVKNNIYYYRTNYVIICVMCFAACFIRNPLALASVALTAIGLLSLNDPFAVAVNDQLLRIIKKVHPKTALRMRAVSGSGDMQPLSLPGGKRRGKSRFKILCLPRGFVVGLLSGIGLLLMWRSAAILTIAWGFLLGVGLPMLHATFRSPNLKARLASAREEFRAVWRGYQAGNNPDYTE